MVGLGILVKEDMPLYMAMLGVYAIVRLRLVKERVLDSWVEPDPIYAWIDKELPTNSIIFEDSQQNTDFISILGHRFTFKPLSEFTVTDYEYVAVGKISPLLFDKPNLYHWLKILEAHPQLGEKYNFYRLDDLNLERDYTKAIFMSENLKLSPLEIPR